MRSPGLASSEAKTKCSSSGWEENFAKANLILYSGVASEIETTFSQNLKASGDGAGGRGDGGGVATDFALTAMAIDGLTWLWKDLSLAPLLWPGVD